MYCVVTPAVEQCHRGTPGPENQGGCGKRSPVDELFCPWSTLVMVNKLVHGSGDLAEDF